MNRIGITRSVTERFGAWAMAHPTATELWLYGSRARADHCADSDVDLAIRLTGPDGVVISLFFAKEELWKAELTSIANIPVDLQLIGFDDRLDAALARDGVQLWARGSDVKKPGAP